MRTLPAFLVCILFMLGSGFWRYLFGSNELSYAIKLGLGVIMAIISFLWSKQYKLKDNVNLLVIAYCFLLVLQFLDAIETGYDSFLEVKISSLLIILFALYSPSPLTKVKNSDSAKIKINDQIFMISILPSILVNITSVSFLAVDWNAIIPSSEYIPITLFNSNTEVDRSTPFLYPQ